MQSKFNICIAIFVHAHLHFTFLGICTFQLFTSVCLDLVTIVVILRKALGAPGKTQNVFHDLQIVRFPAESQKSKGTVLLAGRNFLAGVNTNLVHPLPCTVCVHFLIVFLRS